jgi:hypothetical protein
VTRLRSLVLALGLAACLPAAARAATLETVAGCHFPDQDAQLRGTGFTPDSDVSVSSGGEVIAVAHSDEKGAISTRLDVKPLPAGVGQAKVPVQASDPGGESAKATVYISRDHAALLTPRTSSNVNTWKAVFQVFGFGSGKLFLHYVKPSGELAKTVGLGALKGPCGTRKSRRTRVLPKRNPEQGGWKLQLDTRRRYSAATDKKAVLKVRVYQG